MQRPVPSNHRLRHHGAFFESQPNFSHISLSLNNPQFYDKELHPLPSHSKPVFVSDGKPLQVLNSSQRTEQYPRVARPVPVRDREMIYQSVEPPTSLSRTYNARADYPGMKRKYLPAISNTRTAGEYTVIPQASRKRLRTAAMYDSPFFVSSHPGRQFDHDPANKRITAHSYLLHSKKVAEPEVIDLTLSPPASNKHGPHHQTEVARRPLHVRSFDDFPAGRAAGVISSGHSIEPRLRLLPELHDRPFYVDDNGRREQSGQQPQGSQEVRHPHARKENLHIKWRNMLMTPLQNRSILNTAASSDESYSDRDRRLPNTALRMVHSKQSNGDYIESRQPHLTGSLELDVQDIHNRNGHTALPLWEPILTTSGRYLNHEGLAHYRTKPAEYDGRDWRSRLNAMASTSDQSYSTDPKVEHLYDVVTERRLRGHALQSVPAQQISGYGTVLSHRPKGQQ